MSVSIFSSPNVAFKTSARERLAYGILKLPAGEEQYGVYRPLASKTVADALDAADNYDMARAMGGDLIHRGYKDVDAYSTEEAHALGLILA